MPSPIMSFEDFVDRLRKDVRKDIQKANEKVDEQLPEILEVKSPLKQRSLLISPQEARKHLKGLIERQEVMDEFLDVVSSVRGEKVHINSVEDGHREDGRDKILKVSNPDTGEQLMDYRLLVGNAQRNGHDIRNETSQAAFFKLLNLRVYREKASLKKVT